MHAAEGDSESSPERVGWCITEDAAIKEISATLGFVPKDACTPAQHGAINCSEQLVLYVASSSGARGLAQAVGVLSTLSLMRLLPPLSRIVVIGLPNTPLVLVKSDGQYDAAFLDSPADYGLDARRVIADEIRAVWTLCGTRQEEFRIERHIWYGAALFPRNMTRGEALALSEFIEVPLGTNVSAKESSEIVVKAHEEFVHSDDVRTFRWPNAQLTALRGILTHKSLTVRTALVQ